MQTEYNREKSAELAKGQPSGLAADLARAFSSEMELTDERCSRARLLKVRARREQVPLTIVTASTLYTLQGTTAEPGLIYFFNTPRRLSKVMKCN